MIGPIPVAMAVVAAIVAVVAVAAFPAVVDYAAAAAVVAVIVVDDPNSGRQNKLMPKSRRAIVEAPKATTNSWKLRDYNDDQLTLRPSIVGGGQSKVFQFSTFCYFRNCYQHEKKIRGISWENQ